MSCHQPSSAFTVAGEAPRPGDIHLWHSSRAGKHKFHLCLSWDYDFVFISSPRPIPWHGDFAIACTEFPQLAPTPDGRSIVDCEHLIRVATADDFDQLGAKWRGTLRQEMLVEVLTHMLELNLVKRKDFDRLAQVLRVIDGATTPPSAPAKTASLKAVYNPEPSHRRSSRRAA